MLKACSAFEPFRRDRGLAACRPARGGGVPAAAPRSSRARCSSAWSAAREAVGAHRRAHAARGARRASERPRQLLGRLRADLEYLDIARRARRGACSRSSTACSAASTRSATRSRRTYFNTRVDPARGAAGAPRSSSSSSNSSEAARSRTRRRFAYDAPVDRGATEMRLRPLRRAAASAACPSASPPIPAAEVHSYRDRYGNEVRHFDLPAPHDAAGGDARAARS